MAMVMFFQLRVLVRVKVRVNVEVPFLCSAKVVKNTQNDKQRFAIYGKRCNFALL